MPEPIEKLFSEMYRRLEAVSRPKPSPEPEKTAEERRDPYRQVWKLILEDLGAPAGPAESVPQAG